jgi:hypothetical protein
MFMTLNNPPGVVGQRRRTVVVMLDMRAECERCQSPLPTESPDARICSYECTFCAACAAELGRCPNCGGELLPRPRRLLPATP